MVCEPLSSRSLRTYKGNELSCNLSGDTRPQAPQLAKPLLTDPDLKVWIWCARADLHLKKTTTTHKRRMNRSTFSPKSSQATTTTTTRKRNVAVAWSYVTRSSVSALRNRWLIDAPSVIVAASSFFLFLLLLLSVLKFCLK